MIWSTFIASIDWPTISVGNTDLIMEMLMSLSFKKRLTFMQEWEPVDENNRPKDGLQIIDDIVKKYPETMTGRLWEKP